MIKNWLERLDLLGSNRSNKGITWEIELAQAGQALALKKIVPYLIEDALKASKDLTKSTLTELQSAQVGDFAAADRVAINIILQTEPRLLHYIDCGYESEPDAQALMFAILLALRNHSKTFFSVADNRRAFLRIGNLELGMRKDSETTSIIALVNGFEIENCLGVADRGLVVVQENEILLIEASAKQLFLLNALREQPIVLPSEDMQEISYYLTRLESIIPLTKNFGELSKASARPTLKLAMVGSILEGEVCFVAGKGGNEYVPGEGSEIVFGFGRAYRRDLAAECATAKGLLAKILPDQRRTNRYSFCTADIDESLGIIEVLNKLDKQEVTIQWARDSARIRIATASSDLRVKIESRNDWFDVNGDIEVDGKSIPLKVLLGSVQTASGYIELSSGRWCKISAQIQAGLRAIAENTLLVGDKRSLCKHSAENFSQLSEEFKFQLAADRAWSEALSKACQVKNIKPTPPASLRSLMRPYQIRGFEWLYKMAYLGIGCCLADEMGLGKTLQALSVLSMQVSGGPALVVAPVSLLDNWKSECERFAPNLTAVAYRGRHRRQILSTLKANSLLLVSYATMRMDIGHLTKVDWGTVVLDEAQFAKNALSATSKSLTMLKSKWRLALSGTPLENHLGEVWGLFRLLNPGLFGTWSEFHDKFAKPIEAHGCQSSMSCLSKVVSPLILRRKKSEVLSDLPGKEQTDLYFDLSTLERSLYDRVRARTIAQLEARRKQNPFDEKIKFAILVALLRLRQICCHPSLSEQGLRTRSSKLELLLQTVGKLLNEGHSVLIFSQFTGLLRLIAQDLSKAKINHLYLDGQTKPTERQDLVRRFQNKEVGVFLISLKAGGTGLNLTAADTVIHVDPWWNPAVEDQASDRAHRIGQTRPVKIIRLIARNSIEEKVLQLHERKRELFNGVLGETQVAAKLSTQDLFDLLRDGSRLARAA